MAVLGNLECVTIAGVHVHVTTWRALSPPLVVEAGMRLFPRFSTNSSSGPFAGLFPSPGRSIWRPAHRTLQFPRYASYSRFNNKKSHDYAGFFKSRTFIYSCVGLGGFYLYNLNEAPFTHRLRLLWVPYWLEKKIGDYSYNQILAQYQNRILDQRSPYYKQISGIMNRLLSSAIANTPDQKQVQHLKSLNWSIHIIQATQQEPPNAFILPNGKIFIFSSILPICQNEDGLATVLSHELSHQLAHHSSEQLSKQPIYIMLSTALYLATGISWFNDLLIAGLLQMPSSREMESEADHIGCELMARSCFNVHEAERFWTRMDSYEHKVAKGGVMQDFLSTHPNTGKRIADIRSWMPHLDEIAESSNCSSWSMFQEASRNFFGR